jgi:NADPH2:quinone reductase
VLNAKGSLYLTRPSLAHYVANPEELARRAGDLFDWIAADELEVRIDRTWPLARAAEAHRYIEAGKTRGKVLLLP